MKPLSVGNVVSAGLRIYRDNFAKYFKLAFLGYLWIFAPIVIVFITGAAIAAVFIGQSSYNVGIFVLILVAAIVALVYSSARFAAMSGLIARLAYKEVAEKPETVQEAQRHVKPKMWSFLLAGILSGLIFFGAIIGYSIVSGFLSLTVGLVSGQNPDLALTLGIILSIATTIVLVFGMIWLASRLFLIELPLAVEDGVTAGGTIGRSWELTKGAVGRVQLIILVSFLISLPVFFAVQIVSTIVQGILVAALGNSSPNLLITALIFIYIASTLISSAFMIPFWQSIKAVIYYDLRVRREGMGMNLRK